MEEDQAYIQQWVENGWKGDEEGEEKERVEEDAKDKKEGKIYSNTVNNNKGTSVSFKSVEWILHNSRTMQFTTITAVPFEKQVACSIHFLEGSEANL